MGPRRSARAPRFGQLLVLATSIVVVATGLTLQRAGPVDESPSSVPAGLASSSLLLDAARAGERLVAVGERGHVLLSDDDGLVWRQVVVPTRATLTALFFLDERQGWIVGHDATILRTGDAGESWQLVHHAPEEERPLLDLWFRDARRGTAIGAYGFYLVTADGGESWVARDVLPDDVEIDEFYGGDIDYHLNQIRDGGHGRLFIAAEAGTVLRSRDHGTTWTMLDSPYDGSFFGTLPLDGSSVLLLGLRGHLFRSDLDGDEWRPVPIATNAMLTDAIRLRDGSIVVVGLAGTVLRSRDGGRSFAPENRSDRMGISAVLESRDGGLLLFGDAGAVRAVGARPALRDATP